jgi:hypothetical protein
MMPTKRMPAPEAITAEMTAAEMPPIAEVPPSEMPAVAVLHRLDERRGFRGRAGARRREWQSRGGTDRKG